MLLGVKNVTSLIKLTQSRDTHEDKRFAENKEKSRFCCFFKNNFVINSFERLYFVHCHLHSAQYVLTMKLMK